MFLLYIIEIFYSCFMYQKIVKFVSNNLLIPASSYAVFELGKNYKSIKNYMQNNTIFNKSPYK
jgi:hypothetical protein